MERTRKKQNKKTLFLNRYKQRSYIYYLHLTCWGYNSHQLCNRHKSTHPVWWSCDGTVCWLGGAADHPIASKCRDSRRVAVPLQILKHDLPYFPYFVFFITITLLKSFIISYYLLHLSFHIYIHNFYIYLFLSLLFHWCWLYAMFTVVSPTALT